MYYCYCYSSGSIRKIGGSECCENEDGVIILSIYFQILSFSHLCHYCYLIVRSLLLSTGIPRGLCFEDGKASLQVIGVPRLRELLGAGGLSLDFVFVSACYSRAIGEAFVRAGVKHVVCVKVESQVMVSLLYT